jgi:hypothetical protein
MTSLEWRDAALRDMLHPIIMEMRGADAAALVRYCRIIKATEIQAMEDAFRYRAKRILSWYVASEKEAKAIIIGIIGRL